MAKLSFLRCAPGSTHCDELSNTSVVFSYNFKFLIFVLFARLYKLIDFRLLILMYFIYSSLAGKRRGRRCATPELISLYKFGR